MKRKTRIIDLDSISNFDHYEVAVNGEVLPIAIGDKIQFPADDPYLKTVVGIQLNENGLADYVIEWFEDGVFKQNQMSLTELKVLKDNLKQRATVSFSQPTDETEDESSEEVDKHLKASSKKKERRSKI